ncbi:YraN family protein [Silvibacterium acidisoli]|uniref:YraN family protein n=1 Tax=Acidobacteriaceae bacterium ZG23-2 TaxID=2883246 RepID=UPI00406C5DCD
MTSPPGIRTRLFENVIYRLERASSRNHREAAHLITGRRGELAAYFYLRRQGFTVVARGWKSGQVRGDLDLIAWESGTLCFVEVKTRTTRAFATAEAAVDEDKRRVLRRLARQYLRQLPVQDVPVRFDILSIYLEPEKASEFELFRSAFGWD